MESVFLHLLNMSITAGWLVLAVMVLRLLMKRAPRWMVCLLWVLVAVRLICPVSVESVLSLIPSTETVPTDVVMGSTPTINSGVPVVDAVVNPIISDTLAPTPEYSADPVQIATFVAANVWVIGMVAMLLYALISTLRLRWQVRESACLRRNIRQCDRVATPFILGIIRPRIYLPSTLPAQDALSVVAHEEAHIQRRDHWWKPLGYLLLTVYWFNPLLWVGYILLCRDIEAACDERVIRDMDMEQRRRYSEALLACSMPRRMISACPLAFGETGVKSRIKSVLSYKKPTFWIVLLAVVLTIVAAVCLLTNPKEKPDLGDLDAYLNQVILEQNKKETADGIFACEAHEVFGTKENGRTTTVYGLVYYHEYTYADGDLLERSGSCLPTAITVKKKGKTYQLVEYWVPGTEYAKDLQAKFPEDYHSKVIDYPAADLVALLKAECVSKAWTHFTADAPEERSYLTGKMIEWSKAKRYFLLEVTRADAAELVGKKVKVSTARLEAGGVPVIGSSVDVEYDGMVEAGDPPMVYALDLAKTDSDQLGGPGDPNRTFTGKVIKLSENGREALLECYDKEKFDTVWVYLPEGWSAQIGDEYSVTHTGAVDDSNPPRVSPENISWVSSTPTSNTTESTTGTTVEPTSTTTTTAATTTTTASTTTTTASTTTTTTASTTTEATTATTTASTTTTTTTKTWYSFEVPPDSFTFYCMGETVRFYHSVEIGVDPNKPRLLANSDDWTYVAEDELNKTWYFWQYEGEMKDGTQLRASVLPLSGEVLNIKILNVGPGETPNDETGLREAAVEIFREIGYNYTAEDLSIEIIENNLPHIHGKYTAVVLAKNTVDGCIRAKFDKDKNDEWYLWLLSYDANNTNRKVTWEID